MITFDQALLTGAILSHDEILEKLKSQCRKIDFQERAYPQTIGIKQEINELTKKLPDDRTQIQIDQLEKTLEELKVTQKHYVIITIEEILRIAEENSWGICLNSGFVYLYNGAYWKAIDQDGLKKFFGEVAELLSVPQYDARYHKFRIELHNQFDSTAHLPKPKKNRKLILMNFQNGTLEIKSGKTSLRHFKADDFITHQLPFDYDPYAVYPLWQKFLDEVLPDKERQNVLAEYFASVFVNNEIVKLEKVLMLYGTGSNGKSVVHEVMSALFGGENVSSYGLTSLTNENGYYRAMIVNKLLNYCSEMGAKVNSDYFKSLASGEPVEARLPHKDPFQITDYAKLVFNTNVLPKEGIEQTDAFFRRFLIVHFDITIPKEMQDRKLHLKIISNELPGVFKWVIEGLHRLIDNEGFSECKAADEKLEKYRTQLDSVRSFLVDKGYKKSTNETRIGQEIFNEYTSYCGSCGVRSVSRNVFYERVEGAGFFTGRTNNGKVIYLTVKSDDGDDNDAKKNISF